MGATPAVPSPGRRRARRWALDGAVLSLLAAFGIFWTQGIAETTDIDLWDESSALARGLAIPEAGLPSAQDAPLYALWYGALSGFAADRVDLYFLAHRATIVALPLAFALFLLSAGVDRWAAGGLALALLASPLNLETWPRVGHFAAIVLLVGGVLVTSLDGVKSRALGGLLVALAASFVRPELFLGCVLLLLFLAIVAWRDVGERAPAGRRGARAALVVSVTGFVVVYSASFLGSGDRQLMAFGQHYAVYTARDVGATHAWTAWRDLVARDFGEVESVGEALSASPAAWIRHVAGNLARLPRAAIEALGLLVTPGPTRLAGAGILALLVTGGILLRRGGTGRGGGRRWRELRLAISLVLLPVVLSCLFVYPRRHYLLLLLIPGLALFAVRFLPPRQRASRILAGALLAAVAAMTVLGAPRWATSPRPRLEMLRALREVDDGRPLVVLEAEGADGGFCKFLESPCHRLAPESGEWTAAEVLARGRVDAIVASEALERYQEIVGDPRWPALLDDPTRFGFRRSAIDPRVLLRESAAGGSRHAPEEPPVPPTG
jgi:hypothetical protein